MIELKIFEHEDFGTIRTLEEEDGKMLFCGVDVAKALGYARPSKAVIDHCKGALKRDTLTNGGVQPMSFIPEGDVYRLIARSKLPAAEQFERWVFDEVLPSIRKNGGYIAGQEELNPEELMARALVVAQKTLEEREKRIKNLEKHNAIMEPKAEYFDELVERNTLTSFRETAKLLKVKERKFVKFLKENGYIYTDQKGKLVPYAETNDGLFELKECFNEKTQWSGTQTLITPKGIETFRLLCRNI